MEKQPRLYPGNEDRQITDLYYVKDENIFKQKQINERVHLVGIDEVGCGSLAGSIVTAGVILPEDIQTHIPELPVDSKRLTEDTIRELAARIRQHAYMVHLVYVGPTGVNRKGVQKSTHYSLKKVVGFVRRRLPDIRIQVDGTQGVKGQKVTCIVKGDATEINISAASILAKDFYNRQMHVAHELYPQYDFQKHKGYATPDHQRLIKQHAVSPFHRDYVSKKMEKRKTKNDTANLSLGEIKAYLAESMFMMNNEGNSVNDWQRGFIIEQVQSVKAGKIPSPKAQFYIQKTYRDIQKKTMVRSTDITRHIQVIFEKTTFLQPKNITNVDIRDMFAVIIPHNKHNPTLLSVQEKDILIAALTKLKNNGLPTQESTQQLREIYEKVKQYQLKTA